jgi:hypothetical protein
MASDNQNKPEHEPQYIHVGFLLSAGWVLTIMSRLLKSSDPQLRKAFEQWSETPLKELGIAITTRMHMLGLGVRRLNARVAALRGEIAADPTQVGAALSDGYVFRLKDNDLAYELLLDMDSFIFETRSLYEIVGKFLVALFDILFGRKINEADLQSILAEKGIDTRWITELRESRKLFFHQTAPWLAVQVDQAKTMFNRKCQSKHTVDRLNPQPARRRRCLLPGEGCTGSPTPGFPASTMNMIH